MKGLRKPLSAREGGAAHADICPKDRNRCGFIEACRMLGCAGYPGVGLYPIREQELDEAARYALAMAEQNGR
jgi:hypothetical protein